MVDSSREEFDDLDVSGEARRSGPRRPAGAGRAVIEDESYGSARGGGGSAAAPGGYLGRGGGRGRGDETPEFSAPDFSAVDPSARAAAKATPAKPATAKAAPAKAPAPKPAAERPVAPARSGGRDTVAADFEAAPRRRSSGEPDGRADDIGREPARGGLRGVDRAERPGRGDRTARPSRTRREAGARALDDTPGAVWRLATLASLLWVGGVAAFSIGYYRLPIEPVARLLDAVGALEPRVALMIGAVACAPLGVIWTSALTARRARSVAVETRRAAELVDALERAGAREPAGREVAGRDLAELDDLTARASATLATLERERARLSEMIAEIGAETRRLGDIATSLRGLERGEPARPEPARVETLRAEPSRPEMTRAEAPRAEAARPEPSRPEPTRPEPHRAEPPRPQPARPAASTPASTPSNRAPAPGRDAVLRATDAVVASFGRRRDEADDTFSANARRRVEIDDEDEPYDPDYDGVGDDEPTASEPVRADTGRSEPRPAAPSGAAAATGATARAGGLDWSKLVMAANFPESEDDKTTLDALYTVIKDSEVARLLQSSEDVLSALSDIELYMEDMQPHHAPAGRWRGYIMDGDRRDAIDLGGIRDPHAIEDTMAALEQKPGFKQTTETFLDRYEALLERLFVEAPKPETAVELADTRTGRAYMLLARASGRLG